MTRSKVNNCSSYFMEFMNVVAQKRKDEGMCRTSEAYIATRNSFLRFCNQEDVLLHKVDESLIKSYEFYLRNLRAVYNYAVDLRLTHQKYPFKRVYTGVCKTAKRAVGLDVKKCLFCDRL